MATDRQPEAGAAIAARRRGIRLLEGLEESVADVRRNADAGIRNLEAQPQRIAVGIEQADAQGDVTVLGELECVASVVDRTCPMRSGSPRSAFWQRRINLADQLQAFFRHTRSAISVATLSKTRESVKSAAPATGARPSILGDVGMSLMTLSRCCAESWTLPRRSCWCPGGVSFEGEVNQAENRVHRRPISWLMFARNALLAGWLLGSAFGFGQCCFCTPTHDDARQRSSPISCSSRISEAS